MQEFRSNRNAINKVKRLQYKTELDLVRRISSEDKPISLIFFQTNFTFDDISYESRLTLFSSN